MFSPGGLGCQCNIRMHRKPLRLRSLVQYSLTAPSDPCPSPTWSTPTSGAGSGIGRAVCVRLAQEGATVVACDLNGAAAQETVRLLDRPKSEAGAPGGKHAVFETDVSESRAVRHLLAQVQVNAGQPLPEEAPPVSARRPAAGV